MAGMRRSAANRKKMLKERLMIANALIQMQRRRLRGQEVTIEILTATIKNLRAELGEAAKWIQENRLYL